MLNKRIEVAVGIFFAVVAVAALLLPVLETTMPDSVEVFAPDTFAPMSGSLTAIIDPGHGGEDGGAVSLSGALESEINLSISLKLEQVFAFVGISPVMTRNTSEIDYPNDAKSIREKKIYDQHSRVELVNSTSNGVLISIHQNKFASSSPSGIQVLYAGTNGSNVFASAMELSLTDTVGKDKMRATSQISSDIYLMRSIKCPAVLIECGFLSNAGDEALLLTDEYQLKLAIGISCGFSRAADALTNEYRFYGGTNESKDVIFLH